MSILSGVGGRTAGAWLVVSVFAATAASAQTEKEPSEQQKQAASAAEAQELSKKLSNPVSDLVSVPFQFNWQNGVGPDDDLQFLLNIQPVVPFHLDKDWNLIARFILPYLAQPVLSEGGEPVSGFSDIVFSLFFSPRSDTGFTWGVGPVFGIPTTTDPRLGSGKWSIGPTAVALYQAHGWTYGALVNQLFSFADTGDVDRADVSQMFLQPFVAYTNKHAVTFTLNSEMTANWKAASGEKWTVPINFMVSKLTWFGPFPFSVQAGAGYYAAHPDIGPKWKLRLNFVVLLPSKH
jgi:hypothetical protein